MTLVELAQAYVDAKLRYYAPRDEPLTLQARIAQDQERRQAMRAMMRAEDAYNAALDEAAQTQAAE